MKVKVISKKMYLWIAVFLFVFSNVSGGFAADTTLTWQPPIENEDGTTLDDLAGYILYYGTVSQTYTQSIDVGNVTMYQVSGLSYGTAYYFALTAYDTSGNESVYSSELIKTLQAPDTTAPVISDIQAGSVTYSSAEISWTTDEASDSQIEYGKTTAYGSTTSLSTSMVAGHSGTLGSLSAATLYHYRVRSSDAAGNQAVSGDNMFTTSETPHDYYCDKDGDGYINSSVDGTCTGTGCEPAGCQAVQGNDCNDNSSSIHPGAVEIANDGIDQDCSGSDYVDIIAPKAPTILSTP